MVKYHEYQALKLSNVERARKAQKALGHPPFDLLSMLSARMELFITHALGVDEPNNQKRTRFENEYQEMYAEALDELEKQMREQRLRPTSQRQQPRLIVPSRQRT